MKIIEQNETLYHKYPGQNQAQDAYIEIDYRSRTIHADWNSEIGSGIPMSLYNGHMTRIGINNTLIPDAVNEIMKAIESLAKRICDGYSVEGERGVLNARACTLLLIVEAKVRRMSESAEDSERYIVVNEWIEWLDGWSLEGWDVHSLANDTESLAECHSRALAGADGLNQKVLFNASEDDLQKYIESDLLDGRRPDMNEFNFKTFPKWVRRLPRVADQIKEYLHDADDQTDAVAYYMADCGPDENWADGLDDFLDSVGWIVVRGVLHGTDTSELVAVHDEDGAAVVVYVSDETYPAGDVRRYGMRGMEGKS